MTRPDDEAGAPPAVRPPRADDTPLPSPAPHHVVDPTSRPVRISPGEIEGDFDDVITKPVLRHEDDLQTLPVQRIKPPDDDG